MLTWLTAPKRIGSVPVGRRVKVRPVDATVDDERRYRDAGEVGGHLTHAALHFDSQGMRALSEMTSESERTKPDRRGEVSTTVPPYVGPRRPSTAMGGVELLDARVDGDGGFAEAAAHDEVSFGRGVPWGGELDGGVHSLVPPWWRSSVIIIRTDDCCQPTR